jgi:hypothetical protein
MAMPGNARRQPECARRARGLGFESPGAQRLVRADRSVRSELVAIVLLFVLFRLPTARLARERTHSLNGPGTYAIASRYDAPPR